MFRDMMLGLKREPKKSLYAFFFGVTVLWALLNPIIDFFKIDISGGWKFGVFLIIAIIIALIRVYPKGKVAFKLKNTNTQICVYFGDIFSEKENIAISVNEYFDSCLGKLVSEKSLHGMLIKNVLGGKNELFDNAIDESLFGVAFESITRPEGKTKSYPIGTTAVLEFGSKKYLLFALSKTDENYMAYTSPSFMLESLSGLWKKARSICNGYSISIPLIGSGLAKSGLPPMRIIELILISLLFETKKQEITSNINIVLHESVYEEVDLRQIFNYWR